MITPTGFSNVLNYISGLIDKGRYYMGSTPIDVPILSKSISGNTLTVNVFLSDGAAGTIIKTQLVDTNGQLFADKPDSISKLDTQGVLVIFKFTITEV
ncbi:hypothetical protein [Clostridium beijerinckii]|uniref:hypothetical protein n=1 Tax=Clostridium beijerinckii TaxID=1520 RepID=UPI00232AF037|nr:hypothetical protein [Clostridium beijerinckii]